MRVHPKGENIMAVSGLWKALGWSHMGHFSRFKHKSTFSHLMQFGVRKPERTVSRVSLSKLQGQRLVKN